MNPIILVGPVMVVDKPNLNGRLYSREVFQKALTEYEDKYVKERRALGEMDVGIEPVVHLDRVSHMIASFSWDKTSLNAEIEILDTPQGRVLKELLEKGLAFNVVPRGIGSLKKNEETGVYEVQDDYVICSFDVIPAERSAFRD